jgi:alkylation response protein AidB-like acyl-CoA dehydrogenase
MTAEARYHPSADQVSLADAVNASLADLLPIARLHDAWEETPDTWAALDALGVFGAAVDESSGGSGLGAVEESLIAFGLGRGLAAPAVLATLGAVHARTGAVTSAESGGRRTAAGYRRGDGAIMIVEPGADFLLVREEVGATLYRAPAKPIPLDESLWAARLAEVRDLDAPVARIGPRALLRLRLLDAAALAGLAEAALDMAVGYAKVREQFGQPIGSFQAIRHKCAEMLLEVENSHAAVYYAAWSLEHAAEDGPLSASVAKAYVGDASRKVCGDAIQVHGGIGFTWEYDLHLYFKRAKALEPLYGDADHHRELIVRRVAH